MSIWKQPISLNLIIASREKTMVDHLGIEFTEVGEDSISARMPVDSRTKQPHGIMHGGASCVLAETVASVAGNFAVDSNYYCVGVEINTSHLKKVKEGYVTAIAKPLHLGQTTQVWEIPIHDEQKRLISISRLRLAVLEKERIK